MGRDVAEDPTGLGRLPPVGSLGRARYRHACLKHGAKRTNHAGSGAFHAPYADYSELSFTKLSWVLIGNTP